MKARLNLLLIFHIFTFGISEIENTLQQGPSSSSAPTFISMANSVIELSDSPEPTSTASKASSSTRKRLRADDSSNTEACQACEGTGRVAKKAKKGKKEPEPSRWPWINMRKPDL